MSYCTVCGTEVYDNYCPKCGKAAGYPNRAPEYTYRSPEPAAYPPNPYAGAYRYDYPPAFHGPVSGKSRMITLLLAVLVGWLGVHHFYVGRIGYGLLYLFTGGLFGIGYIVDIILIATGSYKDKYGSPIENWQY